MIATDPFLDRVPTKTYKCMDFAREVWLAWFGRDVGDDLSLLLSDDRKLVLSELRGVEKLDRPISPCFVVMQRKFTVPHIGIWLDGQIFHLSAAGAVLDKPKFATRTFTKVSYYR